MVGGCGFVGKKIDETGFAVWKEDDRFGASLDGVIDKKTGIEIKSLVLISVDVHNQIKALKKK